ncbi:MAG: 16S rRNA (guanine(966)-N(2))-methyltransferase RsmD [Pyrinomonadaceae bacterium]|nr:16S rRNA (guanine(966)-N(2))-methyltransferase RsmD [Pyrinomonadaceae bacterium]
MRIIAGKYRGRNLKSPPSMQVRPTSDRLRETLFNVIAPRIEGTRFLDLCAGSGAIGIEALSRGAAHVTFVDRSRKMCGLVESNLDLVGIPESETEVVQAEAEEFLRRPLTRRGGAGTPPQVNPWDLIYFDPPYTTDYFGVMKMFGEQTQRLLGETGLLVIEHHHKNDLPEQVGNISRQRALKQGDSVLSFYEVEQNRKGLKDGPLTPGANRA